MDFLVTFPPSVVQLLNEFTIRGNNEEVLDLIYQGLTKVIEFEKKPPSQLPINKATTIRIIHKLIKNIKLSRNCKCLTQSYYVLAVLIDDNYNNTASVQTALEWLQNSPVKKEKAGSTVSCSPQLLWSQIKAGILYFIEQSDEGYYPSEYCTRFLACFMQGSSERQVTVTDCERCLSCRCCYWCYC